MRRSVQLILGLITILVAAGAGFYGRNAYLYQVSTLTLPVPRQDIPPYTVLTADLFEMREFPRAMQSMPYYQALDDLPGKISTTILLAGLPVAEELAIPVGEFRLAGAAFEVLSIPIKPVSAVGGQVRIGDRINLYRLLVAEVQACTDPEQCPQSSTLQSQDLVKARAGKVELVVGAVLVVDVRSSRGDEAGPGQSEINSEAGSITPQESEEREQTQILTLAVLPGQVKAILEAVAEEEDAGGLLWVSLALP